MSGIVSDNTEWGASGLVKTPSTGAPDSGSSNPAVDTNPDAVGDRFVNTTSGEMFVATDVTTDENVWKGQLGTDVAPPTFFGGRGISAGGSAAGGASDVIDYVTIASLGNATDFGDLSVAKEVAGHGASNGSRGIASGGSAPTDSDVIEYITFATTGNGTDFGDLTVGRYNGPDGCSNGTRSAEGGGRDSSNNKNTIDYVTIATTGDAADFGDLTLARSGLGSCSSDVRGLWFAGSPSTDIIDYVILASLGNATDFGDMAQGTWSNLGGCSNGTRGLIMGGYTAPSPYHINVIEYITIDTTGDAQDFGDLTVARSGNTGFSDGTKGVSSGDYHESIDNVIDYVNIASLGDASDFGNLTVARYGLAGMSGD